MVGSNAIIAGVVTNSYLGRFHAMALVPSDIGFLNKALVVPTKMINYRHGEVIRINETIIDVDLLKKVI